MGLRDCQFGQFETLNAQYFSRYLGLSGNLIRLRNCFKLVDARISVYLIIRY